MRPSVLAIAAHPDDIEFQFAGTLLLLREAGFDIHYFNLSTGNCGSATLDAETTRRTRAAEARAAARVLGATWHPPIADDLEILYTIPLLRKVAAVVRRTRPGIVLTHSPDDYMEDHENAARLAVTAAFAHGMPNFITDPETQPFDADLTVYHGMPHGLQDGLRRPVTPDAWVDITSVLPRKREALACHASQKEWLDASQGLDSYLNAMEAFGRALGARSGVFEVAEGWRRRSHLGFSQAESDPLAQALGARHRLNGDL